MMWVPVRRTDASFHASTSGCSPESLQSLSPPDPATYPSSVTPICKTTRLIRAPSSVLACQCSLVSARLSVLACQCSLVSARLSVLACQCSRRQPQDQEWPTASPASNTRVYNLMAWTSTPGCCAPSPP